MFAYTKNRLASWSDNKELSLEADVISWNSLSKKEKGKKEYNDKYFILLFVVHILKSNNMMEEILDAISKTYLSIPHGKNPHCSSHCLNLSHEN